MTEPGQTDLTVPVVVLDASTWSGILDFYENTLAAMEAPDWFGRNINALWEAVVQGGFEHIQPPPIEIIVRNAATLPTRDLAELIELSDWVRAGCDELGMNPPSRIHVYLHEHS